MTDLEKAIAQAVADGEPQSKERTNALKCVLWVMRAGPKYIVSDLSWETQLTNDIRNATIFDGRENQELKARFFSAILKTECTPHLLELVAK